MKPIEKCPVCSLLGGHEGAYTKYGWPEYDASFPAAEAKLEILRPNYPGSDRHLIKICPHCGRLYQWDYEYEFLVNGSEDSWDLVRLDEKGIREVLTEEELADWKKKWKVKWD